MSCPAPACLCVALVAAAATLSAQQTFQARSAFVHLPVVVTDRQGAPIAGLQAGDFEILDGGVSQPIVSFAAGGGEGTRTPAPLEGARDVPVVPLHLGVMLDKSQSMDLDAKAAATAVIDFVEAMPEAADVTLVEFDSSVRMSRYEPASYVRLFERIREPLPGETTALFDALGRYVQASWERTGQHVLVVYTDGGDSGRGLNAADVQALLRRGNVLVYTIVYLENQSPGDRVRSRAVLTQLPRETGGEAFFPSSGRDIAAIYERIRAEMAARYTLGYVMPSDATSGQFRRVTVRLRGSADGRRVRTRSGYVVAD